MGEGKRDLQSHKKHTIAKESKMIQMLDLADKGS